MSAVGTDLVLIERSGTLHKATAQEIADLAGSGDAGFYVEATGTGSSQNITLPYSVPSAHDLIVTINGLVQRPVDDYTVSGSTLTITAVSGAEIDVKRPGGGLAGPAGDDGAPGNDGAGIDLTAMQLSNTDTTTDLNQSSTTTVPFATTDINIGSDFTKNGNGVECNFNGHVRVSFNLWLTSAGTRASILNQIEKNGTALGPKFSTVYIRQSGHTLMSAVGPGLLVPVSDGDVLTLNSQRNNTSDAVTMESSGSSYLLVERVN